MSPASGRVIPNTLGVSSLSGALLALGYAFMVFAGIYGFAREPVTSAQHVLGYSLASLAWNGALIVGGVAGVLARLMRLPRVEVVTVETLAVVVWLWAIFVIISPEISDQSAFVLFAIGALFFGWSAGTRRFLESRTRLMDGGEEKGES